MSLDLTLNYSQFNFEMDKLPNNNTYEFEDFRLDASHLLLFKQGEEISLAPKVVETLLVLVENAGQVLGKDEMMEKIWGDSFVEESNLSQNLHRLRKILGNTKDSRPFIETLRRRGYRFVAEVKTVSKISTQKSAVVSDVLIEESQPEFPKNPPRQPAATIYKPLPMTAGSRSILLGILAVSLTALFGFALNAGWKKENLKTGEAKLRRLTENGYLLGAAISPDGNSLAYVTQEKDRFSLRLKNIKTESEFPIIADTKIKIGAPRFSPDGNFIYHSRGSEIFQMPVFGGEARKIASNIWSNFSVSPDGKYVSFPRSNPTENVTSIIIAATDGGGEREVAQRIAPQGYTMWGPAPVFSPDGDFITAVVNKTNTGEMKIVNISLQTGEESELQIQNHWEEIEYIDWKSPDELFISAKKKDEDKTQIWSVKFPAGETKRVTNDFNDYVDFSFNSDKTKLIAVQETENIHLWSFDAETGAARQITSGISRAEGRFGLAAASDGRIIFTARDKNNYDIFSVKADGSDIQRLTQNGGRRNYGAVISPDDQSIAFISDRTGEPRLWRMNADGTGAQKLSDSNSDTETTDDAPYFSADGQWIYYVQYNDRKGSIRRVSINGGKSSEVSRTDKNVFEPVPSPDGKLLAHAVYNDETDNPWQIGIQSLNDSDQAEKFFEFPAFRLRVR